MEIKVAFARRDKNPTIGPYIFQERLAQYLESHPEVKIGRAGRWHNIHFINMLGSGRRADQYGAKKILRVDGIYHDTTRDSDKDNQGIRNTYHAADGVIFQCNFAREMLYRHFGPPKNARHEAVIYNGVDASFSPEGTKYSYGFEYTIICSARWQKHKRILSIIETFLELSHQQKDRDIGLVILGDNNTVVEQHPKVKHFHVAPHELPKYYRGADVMLHFAYTDWCPNAVVEALACGVPVITTHNGGTPELIRNSGAIIKSDPDYDMKFIDFGKLPQVDEKLAANAVAMILENKESYAEERPDLSMEHCGQQYVDFFKEVLK